MIYFIRNTRTNNVKIGWSEKPEQRLKSLQTSHEDPLKLEAAVRAERKLEHRLHYALRTERLHGEWFKGSPLVECFIGACSVSSTLNEAADLQRRLIGWAQRDNPGRLELVAMLERRIAAGLQSPDGVADPSEDDVLAFFARKAAEGLL